MRFCDDSVCLTKRNSEGLRCRHSRDPRYVRGGVGIDVLQDVAARIAMAESNELFCMQVGFDISVISRVEPCSNPT